MKTARILKMGLMPVLVIFTSLCVSNIALADYQTGGGSGGDYRYELWSSDDGSYYYLKIWSDKADPNDEPSHTTRGFQSSRDALIYFDCNYAGKSLPECTQ